LRGCFLGDFGFEIAAFVDKLAVGVVAIGFEAGDHLFLMQSTSLRWAARRCFSKLQPSKTDDHSRRLI